MVALFILLKRKNENPIHKFYLLYVFIFTIGIGLLICQMYNIINYWTVKDDNNMVNATIYSDIYETGISSEKYKAVSYYYADNNKYIYVDETYKNGDINDVVGTTQELYYNPDNPAQASNKINPLNFFLLIIGIFITAFTFPIVFLRNKMANRYNKNLKK